MFDSSVDAQIFFILQAVRPDLDGLFDTQGGMSELSEYPGNSLRIEN